MSRLLFKRYLVPFDPLVILIPLVVVSVAVLVWSFAGTGGGTDVDVAGETEDDTAADPAVDTAADTEDDGSGESARAPGESRPTESAGEGRGGEALDADEPPETGEPPEAREPPEPREPRDSQKPRGSQLVELTFLGDIMAHRVNFSMSDYSRIYRDVEDELGGDDLTFANLETPVVASHPYESYPRFNVKPEYARAAVEAGVDVFSAANNHAADRGPDGVEATRSALGALESIGLSFGGLRRKPGNGFEAVTLEVDGRDIGFVAVTQSLNGLEDGSLVQTVDYRDDRAAERFVRWLSGRAQRYDLLVVSYHGGREYELEPDAEKARFFERLVRAGADIVWSHHPHVVQPWRHLERRDGSQAIILHSTGNFISGQSWGLEPEQVDERRAHTGDGALFRVSVRWDDAERTLIRHDPLFVANYRDPQHGMVVRRMDDIIGSDIDERWKRYYVLRRNALQETAKRSTKVRLSLLD